MERDKSQQTTLFKSEELKSPSPTVVDVINKKIRRTDIKFFTTMVTAVTGTGAAIVANKTLENQPKPEDINFLTNALNLGFTTAVLGLVAGGYFFYRREMLQRELDEKQLDFGFDAAKVDWFAESKFTKPINLKK